MVKRTQTIRQTICLSVFDRIEELTLKGLRHFINEFLKSKT